MLYSQFEDSEKTLEILLGKPVIKGTTFEKDNRFKYLGLIVSKIMRKLMKKWELESSIPTINNAIKVR